jgi:DNA-binding response OmpR family regulator
VSQAQENHQPSPAGEQRPRVLIVEDNPTVARPLSRLLQHAGFQPVVFHRGHPALDYARQCIPDAALVDVHLPDFNGLLLSRHLRQHLGPDRPIVVLSGDTSMEVVNSLAAAGATYFFSKPVRGEDLVRQLKALIP